MKNSAKTLNPIEDHVLVVMEIFEYFVGFGIPLCSL